MPRIDRWVRAATLLFVSGCADRRPEVTRVPDEIETPALDDRGDLCTDVADVRACWTKGDGGPVAVPRPLPRWSAPEAGFRCYGAAEKRRCASRARNAGAFACTSASCVQNRPRLPSDGEWECAEMEGIVYCHGGTLPAGVPSAHDDPNWLCGPRAKTPAGLPEQVCVDLSPERPLVEPNSWECRFEYAQSAGRRTCTPSSALRLGARCKTSKDCPDAMACAGARCVPRDRPAPECWYDKDCASASVCRWGTCVRAAK